jgi:hypothetical protein
MKALRQIADRCRDAGTSMVLLTCSASNIRDTNKPNEATEAKTAELTEVIRRVAKEYGWPVADVYKLQAQARSAGEQVISADGAHPNLAGEKLYARALLDAMGLADVPLPKEFRPQIFPGVIREWKLKSAMAGNKPQPLMDEVAAGLKPDDTWTTLTLPQQTPATTQPAALEEWRRQLRTHGFALNLDQTIGKGSFYAMATVKSAGGKAYINTASNVQKVYLNGKKVYEHAKDKGGSDEWTGYHAGKERIEVELQKGDNTLLIQHAGGDFFVSVTDKRIWEEDITFGRP